jgi:putative Ca2+/H+ antiporter (TMEM165/GDT1 family)
MSWKVLLTAFGTIFLAELGDKTQLATLSMAAGARAKWSVFFGAALALCASSAVAVVGGEAIARVLPPIWLRRIAGAAFIVLGLLYLLRPAD